MNNDHDRQATLAYHERTKHHPQRFARSLGHMDWANQPDPFRRYEGAERLKLPFGQRNPLSRDHQEWPVIDEVSRATRRRTPIDAARCACVPAPGIKDRGLPARKTVRGRRSAVAMDGSTRLDRKSFLAALHRLMPSHNPVFSLLPQPVFVSLVLFVHRVDDVEPGVYCLVRDPEHQDALRFAMSDRFEWRQTSDLPLFLLSPGDYRQQAGLVSCRQEIAADGVFAAAMLARFEDAIGTHGPSV